MVTQGRPLKDPGRESRDACVLEVRMGCSGKGHLKGDTTPQGRSGDRRVAQQGRHVPAVENGHLTDGQWSGAPTQEVGEEMLDDLTSQEGTRGIC